MNSITGKPKFYDWIDVNESTPLPQYDGQQVISEFLVTLQLINKDPQDDDEVTIAAWDSFTKTWRYIVNINVQYDNDKFGWKVIAWMPLPKPYVR